MARARPDATADHQLHAMDGSAGWFGIPSVPTSYVRRARLLDLVDAAQAAPLTLVSAPAGSGKTSVVADWVASRGDRRHTGWVTFEEADGAFWPGVVGGLARLGVAAAAHAYPDAPVPLDRGLLVSLAAAVGEVEDRLTLVVDGYEVASAAIADDLEFLLRHSSKRLRLVIVTRADPVLPLYRYRLEDTLAEVRMADLAFTDDEAAELLRRCGVGLSDASVRVLNRRTQGWVAGLRFAARFLVERDDPDEAVAEVAGDSGNIGEYLMSEVLAVQTPEIRDLLLSTSIPETLRPGLAEELGGRSASRTLELLCRANTFVEPVPEHPGFYRYHPFFRELLLAELAYRSPEAAARLQLKAAAWFADAGFMAAAVSHYAAVDAWPTAAARVVEELAVGELLLSGGSGALARSLRSIPVDLDDPAAAVVRATLALADGDTATTAVELDRVPDAATPTSRPGSGSLGLAVAVLRAVAAGFAGEPAEALALVEDAERALDRPEARLKVDGRHRLATLVSTSKGIASTRAGDLVSADELFTRITGGSSAPGTCRVVVVGLAYGALIACYRGEPSRALALATRAVQVADDNGLPEAERPAAAHAALAWVDMGRYDLASAAERIRLAGASDRSSGDPVVRTLVDVVRSWLLVARGDPAAALTVLRRAAGGVPDPGSWLRDRLRVEAAHLRVVDGEPDVALLELDEVERQADPNVALARAEAELRRGAGAAVRESLAPALATQVSVGTRVSALLVEAGRQLQVGSEAGARRAVRESLRLAAPDRLRRPFWEAPTEVRELLSRDARLAVGHAWLGNALRGRGGARTDRRPVHHPPAVPRPAGVTPVVETLTAKELEVLGHLSELLTTEEIASTMFISVNTIRTHVRSILRKLGVSRRNAAVRRARELELLNR